MNRKDWKPGEHSQPRRIPEHPGAGKLEKSMDANGRALSFP